PLSYLKPKVALTAGTRGVHIAGVHGPSQHFLQTRPGLLHLGDHHLVQTPGISGRRFAVTLPRKPELLKLASALRNWNPPITGAAGGICSTPRPKPENCGPEVT